ncbi:MAG: ABC transporter substrate-binding protein [Rhodospirillaceae bacterium]|nr:ABC transporter substrate-binding protein [Rhodospirillaceae bacterium]
MGEQERIVGISGYVVRPPEARREKPRVSAFTSADTDKILKLEPDLVLAFSDLQAGIVAELIRQGIAVHAFNQRTVAGILDMVRLLGAMVGAAERGSMLADRLAANVEAARERGAKRRRKPRVYFEEWDEPMISGIGWVSELIEVAGAIDVFADRAQGLSAKERIVTAAEVIDRAPDILVGSWCGKKFRPEKTRARPGFEHLEMHEIKSALILQPGPAALTDGLAALERIVQAWGSESAST